LAQQSARHKLAEAAFDFVYGWGGLWSKDGVSIAEPLAASTGVTPEEVLQMKGCISRLFRAEGMGEFIKAVNVPGASWEALILLPYFAKGVGVRRFEAETGLRFGSQPWQGWKDASRVLEQECKAYEQCH